MSIVISWEQEDAVDPGQVSRTGPTDWFQKGQSAVILLACNQISDGPSHNTAEVASPWRHHCNIVNMWQAGKTQARPLCFCRNHLFPLLGTMDPLTLNFLWPPHPRLPGVSNLFSCSCSEHETVEWFLVGLQLRVRAWPLVKEILYNLPWNTIKWAFLVQGWPLSPRYCLSVSLSVCLCMFKSPGSCPRLSNEPSHSAGTPLQGGRGTMVQVDSTPIHIKEVFFPWKDWNL